VISALAEERDNILQYVEPLRSRLANNERDVEAISRHELAGIDENVERVIDLLVKHGIRDVLPYAVWLSKQGLDAAAMRDFAVKDPGVFSGVSVPGDTMLTKARALMGTDIGLLRPVTVSVGRLTPLVGDDPIVFDAVRPEAYDRDSALKLRDSLDEKQEELRRQISDAQSKSAAVDDLIRAIDEFNKKGGHARLASLQQEVAEMVGRKDSLRGILLMSRTTIKATEGRLPARGQDTVPGADLLRFRRRQHLAGHRRLSQGRRGHLVGEESRAWPPRCCAGRLGRFDRAHGAGLHGRRRLQRRRHRPHGGQDEGRLRRRLDSVELESRLGFTFAIELMAKAVRLGRKVDEEAARWYERADKPSRFRVMAWLPAYLFWLRYSVETAWLRRGPETVTLRRQP